MTPSEGGKQILQPGCHPVPGAVSHTEHQWNPVYDTPERVPCKMKKYWHALKVGIQNNLTYRFNFLARTVFGFLPLIAVLFVWRAIYAEKGQNAMVGSYTLAEMISYYLLATIVDALTAVNEDDWQIAADIKDGNISQFVLKPIDYLVYRLFLFFSGRLTYLAVAAVPLAIFVLCLHQYFVLPPNWPTFGLFLVSTFLTALLQFFISYGMAMLAFWVLEVSTFIFIVFAFEYIASGHMFPLDILPQGLSQLLQFTPFPYQMYFPVSLYLGKMGNREVLVGLLIQSCWVMATYAFARFMWQRGLRKYSAVGG
jgi:ABC-2 type transport system permease protein